mmetsp:Transcript_9822/g.20010  ORF Transcript_9822/g.20010 Transcript_9822/m.20010 type:complete len:234 (+) Transcript_9822:119-820(+)
MQTEISYNNIQAMRGSITIQSRRLDALRRNPGSLVRNGHLSIVGTTPTVIVSRHDVPPFELTLRPEERKVLLTVLFMMHDHSICGAPSVQYWTIPMSDHWRCTDCPRMAGRMSIVMPHGSIRSHNVITVRRVSILNYSRRRSLVVSMHTIRNRHPRITILGSGVPVPCTSNRIVSIHWRKRRGVVNIGIVGDSPSIRRMGTARTTQGGHLIALRDITVVYWMRSMMLFLSPCS